MVVTVILLFVFCSINELVGGPPAVDGFSHRFGGIGARLIKVKMTTVIKKSEHIKAIFIAAFRMRIKVKAGDE